MPTTATSILVAFVTSSTAQSSESTRNAARSPVAGGATQSTCENPAALVLTWVLCAAPTCLPYLTLICFSQSRGATSTCNLQLRLHLVFFPPCLALHPRSQPSRNPHFYMHAVQRRGFGTMEGPLLPYSPEPSDGLQVWYIPACLCLSGNVSSGASNGWRRGVQLSPAPRASQPCRPHASRSGPALPGSLLKTARPLLCTPQSCSQALLHPVHRSLQP